MSPGSKVKNDIERADKLIKRIGKEPVVEKIDKRKIVRVLKTGAETAC